FNNSDSDINPNLNDIHETTEKNEIDTESQSDNIIASTVYLYHVVSPRIQLIKVQLQLFQRKEKKIDMQ
ncbi:9331_t:CDS:1, partial [Ambispora gerdemannii]